MDLWSWPNRYIFDLAEDLPLTQHQAVETSSPAAGAGWPLRDAAQTGGAGGRGQPGRCVSEKIRIAATPSSGWRSNE